MANPRPSLHRQACLALIWGLALFWGVQVALGIAVEYHLPHLRDEEFAEKRDRLHVLTLGAPDRPLVLMLGSSRTLMAFDAGRVHATLNGRTAHVFNFGVRGGGPALQLICLRRLLAEGVKPDLLLVEVLLPLLNQPGRSPLEETWLHGRRLQTSEIAGIRPYHTQPRRLARHWLSGRWAPCFTYRREMRNRFLRLCESPPSLQDPHPGAMDAHGWQPFFVLGITAEQRGHFWKIACSQYERAFGPFRLSEPSSRALEALLDLCRQNGIPVALVLPPEGNEFRALYPPETLQALQDYVNELGRRRGLPLIDARDWLEDESFWDGHHALPEGAAVFTQRLQHEALGPLLKNWPRGLASAQAAAHP